jgi:hypothetical protein
MTEILKLAKGAMTEVPLYREGRDYSNYCAIITRDEQAQGGLNRDWVPRGAGKGFYYTVEGLKVGMVLEFGSKDKHARYGDKKKWYGVIIYISETALHLEQYPGGKTALKAALKIQKREETGFGRAARLRARQGIEEEEASHKCARCGADLTKLVEALGDEGEALHQTLHERDALLEFLDGRKLKAKAERYVQRALNGDLDTDTDLGL